MSEENNKPNFYSLYQTVGKMDGKLDVALAELKNHQERINTVERVQDQMVGKISVWASIFGFVGGIITTIMATLIRK